MRAETRGIEDEGPVREQFYSAPIPIWIEDWSKLKKFVDRLSAEGVTDFEAHFARNPDDMEILRRSVVIVDMNDAAIVETEASSKQEALDLHASFEVSFSVDGYPVAVNAFMRGQRTAVAEITEFNRAGEPLNIIERFQLLEGDEEEWANIVSVTLDVTELRNVTTELEIAKQRAEAANLAKGAFIATMSHEIRTPMNGIIGMASLLRHTELTDEQADYCATIADSAEALLTIINDILDYSKVEAGKLELSASTTNVVKIVDDVMSLLAIKIEEKGLELTSEKKPGLVEVAFLDGHRLRQILINLLNNAIKFTEKGQITLLLESRLLDEKDQASDCEYRFVIEDTGIGIPGDKLDSIFDSFTQVDASTTRKYGGTGLGLAISKDLVKLMGGSIRVESVVGVGTKIVFTVVGGAVSVADKAELESRDSSGAKAKRGLDPTTANDYPLRILLVDDNPINRKMAGVTLKKLGYEIGLASDGKAAVNCLRADNYDLVFMDIEMPIMDGVDATVEIRKMEHLDPQPCITAMTANAMAGDRERYIDAGMDGYISKPFSLEDLLHELKRASFRIRGRGEVVDGYQAIDSEKLSQVHELIGDDEDVFAELVDCFFDTGNNIISDLSGLLSNPDTSELRRLAHTLKGSAETFGALHLKDLCATLERQLRESETESLEEHVNKISKEFQQASWELSRYLADRAD